MSMGVTGPWVGGKGLSVGTPRMRNWCSPNAYLSCSNFRFYSCYLIADSSCCVHVSIHPTIELLDALNVIVRKSEVFGEGVNGGHQSSRVLRVLQTKGVTELMGCHQEQTVTYKTHKEMAIPSKWPIFTLLYNYLSSANNQNTSKIYFYSQNGENGQVTLWRRSYILCLVVSLFYQLLKCPQTLHTLIGTEAPFAVVIIALGGSAPHLAVAAPGRGAGVVGVSQESEGKDARAPLCVSSHGGHRWWERQQDQRMRPGTRRVWWTAS